MMISLFIYIYLGVYVLFFLLLCFYCRHSEEEVWKQKGLLSLAPPPLPPSLSISLRIKSKVKQTDMKMKRRKCESI